MDPMSTNHIERAMKHLGEFLEYHQEIEILIVGGAAGMLTGVLAANKTTMDCDVMVCVPENALVAVELAAEQVAEEMSLDEHWLNSDVQLRLDALPDGWRHRRITVGKYGMLSVFAASRPDLIAMKVLAGRDQDIEDLEAMRVREDDVEFIRTYLDGLDEKGTHQEQIDDARILLESLELHEHE